MLNNIKASQREESATEHPLTDAVEAAIAPLKPYLVGERAELVRSLLYFCLENDPVCQKLLSEMAQSP